MFQQIIALIIIIFFLSRLFWQKKKKELSGGEFKFWFFFWFSAGVAIFFIKQIDRFVLSLGFSGQGIEVLFYATIILLLYFVFRIRLRLERIEKDLTKITRELTLK